MDRVSATLSERVAEVERAMQTQSATPAITVEPNPTTHEDIARLNSKIEAGFRAFPRDVDDLREEMSQAIDGQDKDLRGWARGKIARTLHASSSTAASSSAARAPTPTQDYGPSERATPGEKLNDFCRARVHDWHGARLLLESKAYLLVSCKMLTQNFDKRLV